MHLVWTIWVNTKTEAKASRLFSQIIKRMEKDFFDKNIESESEIDGFVVHFSTQLKAKKWNDAVVDFAW